MTTDNKRSGGPMAATVDRVMHNNTPVEDSVRLPVLAKFSLVPANWLFGDRNRIEVAIKSAAEKAAQQIGNEVNEIVERGQVPVFWNGEGLKTCQQWIERHMREALGL